MEDITAKALPQLNDNAKPNSIEDDWIANFFDKSRIISGEEMQSLWARVLAGEANAPGAFSKRTVNSMADLDKQEAILFTQLCGFVWKLPGRVIPLMFGDSAKIYNRAGINFESLVHLESIGLIQHSDADSYRFIGPPKRCRMAYYGRSVTVRTAQGQGDRGWYGDPHTHRKRARPNLRQQTRGWILGVCDGSMEKYLPKPVTEQRPAPGSDTTNTPSN